VDFITDVKMFVTVDETTSESANMEEISASTARSILVSVPASKHTIIPYTTTENTLEEICIDKNNVK